MKDNFSSKLIDLITPNLWHTGATYATQDSADAILFWGCSRNDIINARANAINGTKVEDIIDNKHLMHKHSLDEHQLAIDHQSCILSAKVINAGKKPVKITPIRVVLESSPHAAQLSNRVVWKSADGKIFKPSDEKLARYCGATHRQCSKCNNVFIKNSYCEPCYEKQQIEKFKNLPVEDWGGETPLAIFGTDTFFFDEQELADYCTEGDTSPSLLNLVKCKGKTFREVDTDYWEDVLPDDCSELPDEIQTALDNLNKVIRANSTPASYVQDDIRVKITSDIIC